MDTKQTSLNKTIKLAAIFLIIAAILGFIYIAQGILIPLVIAFIFAVLLLPMVNFFKNKLRFVDLLAVLTTVIIAVGVLLSLVLLLGKQISYVFNDFPEIQGNLTAHFENIQAWIKSMFDISYDKQNALLVKTVKSGKVINSGSLQSLGSLTSVFLNMVLIPIYTFLILIYRTNFVKFVHAFDKNDNAKNSTYVLNEINNVLRQYIVGLGIEMLIVALLTGFGLWIIGLKYFLFLGVLTALLNLIPYIGILIACTISILLAIVGSTDLNLIIGVVIVNIIVQLIDNNILIPKIVGSKVSINALASMLAVIIGGALSGVGGMFLAIPILAILKVIFDHYEAFKPFSHLIGEKESKLKKT